MWRSVRRPISYPSTASRRRWSSVPLAAAAQLRLQRPVLLTQEIDDVLLLALEPSGKRRQDRLKRVTRDNLADPEAV